MTSAETGTLVSRWRRRNSTLEHWTAPGGDVIRKHYTALYSCRDEAAAYERLKPALTGIDRLTLATVRRVDTNENWIELIYVDGETLASKLVSSGFVIFDSYRKPVLDLMVLTHDAGIKLDSDPSNFLIERDTGDLIVVDPICVALDIQHFVACVFMWGLIKCFVRRAYIPWRWAGLRRALNELETDYVQRTNTELFSLHADMATYIDCVIGWNLERSGNESYLLQSARRAIVVPLWRLIGARYRRSAQRR